MSKQCVDESGKEYHGDTYIIGVYLHKVETAREIRVGDTKELIFQQYGHPDAIQASGANTANMEVVYTRGESSIIFTLDETASVIEHIFIDYNMARSVEEQGL